MNRSSATRVSALAALVMAAGAAPAFASDSRHGWLLPDCISDVGDKTDHLWWFIFAITMFTFVLTEGALLWFLWKYRTRPGHKAFYTHGSHKLEIIWTIIPALILAVIAMVQMGTWLEIKDPNRMPTGRTEAILDAIREDAEGTMTWDKAVAATANPEEPYAYEVDVLAKQFAWNFRYPGKDGLLGTKDDFTHTELVIPVNRPVVLHMRSIDVIHSLYLPHARFKQDVVPGLTIKAWIQVRETGTFPIVCAELCGIQHYTMASRMHIYDDAALEKELAKLFEERGAIDMKSGTEFFRFWPIEGAPK